MNKNSNRPHPLTRIRLRVLRAGVLGALLAGSFSVAGSAPVVVSAATAIVGTSTHALAFQHSTSDKVAYLHDGSLLVGFFDGGNVVIRHVTNPATAPVSTTVDTISGGSEVTLYTLPGVGSTEIWVQAGNELVGGTLREQIQYGTYNGTAFSFGAVHPIPGALTNGRQDPSVTWTGKWLIATWWDDTMGGNSDSVFMNWTTDKTGATGWLSKYGTTTAIIGKNGTTAAATAAAATSITYNAATGGAPAINDVFVFGYGTVNTEIRTVTAVAGTGPYTLTVAALTNAHAIGEIDTLQTWMITYGAVTGGAPNTGELYQFGNGTNAEYRTVAVTGTVLTIAGLANLHATGETDTQEAAIQLTAVGSAIAQVSIRHSAKLGATIAVYGARSHIYTRTLLDSKANPSLSNWTAESLIDAGFDDSEWGFGGPQIAIDETTGKIHVFRAVTNHGGPTWTGVTYWLGTPDAAPMVSGAVTWNSRLVIDAAAGATDPPDIAGAVDSTGKVYVFWTTTAIAGAIKYVTLVSPYTAFTPAVTVATTGANPRFPHLPAQAPLTGGIVPLVYQSGSGPYSINLDTIDGQPPTVPTGLNASATSLTPQVNLSWNASTDNVLVTGYTIYRDGVALTTVSGTTLTYADMAVASNTAYSYTVDAFDAAGNHSAQSAAATITTPDFAAFNSLGGVLIGGPDASASSASKADVFVRGTDNQLWHKSWNGTGWGSWEPLGGVLTSDPGVVALGPSNISVFVRGSDNQLWELSWNGSAWSDWQPLGGGLTSGPDADGWISGGTTHMDVFVRGTDNGLWHKWSDNGVWYNWEPLGGRLTSDPGTVSWGPNRADVFVRGTDNQLWHKWWDGIAWRPWEPLGGILTSGPDPASCTSGHLDVFAIGTDGMLWRKGYNGTSWSQWQPEGGQWTADPGAVCNLANGTVNIFTRGTDNGLWVISVPAS